MSTGPELCAWPTKDGPCKKHKAHLDVCDAMKPPEPVALEKRLTDLETALKEIPGHLKDFETGVQKDLDFFRETLQQFARRLNALENPNPEPTTNGAVNA